MDNDVMILKLAKQYVSPQNDSLVALAH